MDILPLPTELKEALKEYKNNNCYEAYVIIKKLNTNYYDYINECEFELPNEYYEILDMIEEISIYTSNKKYLLHELIN